jgi:DNA-3-methyladenine glycosylase II
MFGIDADLTEFYRLSEGQPKLNALVRRFRGVKPPRFPTVFEALVNAVACQQLSLTVGIRILNRLASAFGPSMPEPGLNAHGFPGPRDLSPAKIDALKPLGFSGQKARSVIELAHAISEKQLDIENFEEVESDEEAIARLRQLRGVGRWSAEYALLRGLGRLHIFPGDDTGARGKLQRWLEIDTPLDYEGVRRAIAPWKACGGLVYFHLLLKGLEEAGAIRIQ